NAVTTNLTAFFRERHHFDYLREAFLKPRLADPGATRRIRIWCAAVSTGEEAWSAAITVADAIPDWQRWDIRILGTDLDTNVLRPAAAGAYPPDRLQHFAPGQVERRFTRHRSRSRARCQGRPELPRRWRLPALTPPAPPP